MADIIRWQTLACPCGSTAFYQVFALRRHPTGGMSQEPVGQRCAECNKDADTAAMLRQMQLERRRQELAAIEEELSSSAPAVVPPPVLPR